jgi:hypothetical protein
VAARYPGIDLSPYRPADWVQRERV